MDVEKAQRRAGEFAARYRTTLLNRARKWGQNEQDAQDLVQETLKRFIDTFGSVDSLPSERSCEAWLSNTFTHLFTTQYRKQKTQRKAVPELLHARAIEESSVETLPPVYDSITDEQIQQAFDELTPDALATLKLDVEGKTGREIAGLLRIREGAVRKRLHDARKKLRKVLQRFLPPGDN
ncbi:RNA polymerase sigma factor [Cystobacter fuscus]|nr:RNA polymerase sigma factor [Cystobacter fuscus]